MSWMRFLLLGDVGQQLDIHELEGRLAKVGNRARGMRQRDTDQDTRIEALERQVMELDAGLGAVVDLLRSKNLVADSDIEAALEASAQRIEQVADEKRAAERVAADATRKQQAAERLQRIRRKPRSGDRTPRRT